MELGLPAPRASGRQAFGAFVIDAGRAQVTRDGQQFALRPKTFALLVHLVDRAGTVVGKQELMDSIWPGLVVTDDSLTQAVSELRGALGDRSQQLIKTIPKRGYLLDAVVRAVPAMADELPTAVASPAAPARRRWHPASAALVGIAVAAGTGYALWQTRATPAEQIGNTLAESRSLAVMPFTDLSEPPAPHLALAVDTDLSTDLGRLADTRVMPRSAAAPLGTSAGVDLKRVGRELDVRHVVTGTVRRDGEHVQVTAQLMRADTGALLWAERFDYGSAADWVAGRAGSARLAHRRDQRRRHATDQHNPGAAPQNPAIDPRMGGTKNR
jgi:DNA-binding winged helix-turn-helix (wHTH) protein/TolB-like protein